MASKIGSIMIVGGGIAGIQAALDLADSGFKVYIVEKTPTLGGVMARLDKTFPTNDCSMCILAPKLVTAARHQNIQLFMNSELKEIKGQAGNFKATVHTKARHVDETKCIGCGTCAQKCPKKVPSEFDEGLGTRKAIYVPFPQAVPLIYTIDAEQCLQLTKGKCGTCAKVCPAGAIAYDQKDFDTTVDVGTMLLMPGYECFDPSIIKELGYEIYDNVLSSMEFERVLNASGPFGGHVVRPSDDQPPKRVAFLLCIGSRDEMRKAPYCSSVCCMYSIKEAIIAKEHSKDIEPTIFFMDIRAFGKDFEKYYLRAQNEYGIKFIRSRVAGIEEVPSTRNVVKYVENNKPKEAEFDMVVLATGFRPPKVAGDLAKTLGIKLNDYGFCATKSFEPLDTSVPGIFVGGAFAGPRDIPETVANASGAASRASSVITESRGTLVQKKQYPKEMDVTKADEPRIGVFICRCGINIGATVDVPAVVEYAKTLPNVVFASENMYTCSGDTQTKIKDVIKEHKLNRILVASCTPRTHEPLFRSTVREAGLNPYLLEMANIRDQCSWVHMNEPQKATMKAKILVRMAVAKSRLAEALPTSTFSVNHTALVIGGGLSGMTAALEIASQDFKVELIEKEFELGGNLKRVFVEQDEKTGFQFVSELILKIGQNRNINVHLGTKIEKISGFVGNFEVDTNKGHIKAGAIIVAIGGHEYEPTEYLYGQDERVMTQLELADLLDKKSLDAKVVAMIQCVGSRTKDNPMCSRVCCTTAMKNAIKIMRTNPESTVYMFHKDIRTYGFREDLYLEAARLGAVFIRCKEDTMPELEREGDGLKLSAYDASLEGEIALKPDVIILSTGIRPNADNEEISKLLKVPLDKDGFFLEAHMKLRPIDFETEGVFMAGLAHWPKSADESIAEAAGAASRVITIISKEKLDAHSAVSVVDESKCRGCGMCEAVCPFSAISAYEINPGVMKYKTNPILCKGCGACEVACCTGAITCKHFTDKQIIAQVEACLEEDVV